MHIQENRTATMNLKHVKDVVIHQCQMKLEFTFTDKCEVKRKLV